MTEVQSWAALAGNSPAAHDCRTALIERWCEPHRRYHGLAHLRAVLEITDEYATAGEDPRAVGLAAWFHDAVYDPTRADNEQRSADLAVSQLPAIGVPSRRVTEVARLVLLTVGHAVQAGDSNGALLCSADLAVLGGSPPAYAAYADGIRTEYAHIGDADFRLGRAAVLRGLLARPVLFGVPELADRWESAARTNITAELATLSA